MGSTRLPGKVLLPLGQTNVLNYVVTRCKEIQGISKVIVATSHLDQDQPIVDWCRTNDILYFRGSEDDVLDRYYQCALEYNPDYVMRVTADCPFLDYHLASNMVDAIQESTTEIDIVTLLSPIPRGMPVEIISFESLQYIHNHGKESYHREHVTYYAYENPSTFHMHGINVDTHKNHPELRITLDTPEDYLLCQEIVKEFPDDILVPADKVIEFLLMHPEIVALNAHIEQKVVKL
ncbi:acylneuraminate cytidylyltransferase [Desulfuribacillus stibiiarsenatis]|uniref:Acylneuraminate cytidylyltransferase n=2 Tax=Desulfuribacillus stibiiarsenatis TaxID=1390249 RepID=A0A1E5LAE9_9FIRM|nr:acylneuraminate cytidylyltransferase [Desulfuribacillus stibiiarsenatis]